MSGARMRFDWLNSVIDDRSISPATFKLAYLLALRFHSDEKGYAFPSQETLAGILDVCDRQVRTLVGELVTRGHLAVRRGGRGRSNRYVLLQNDRKDSSGHEGQPAETREEGNFRSSVDDRKNPSGMTGRKLPTTHLRDSRGGSGAPGGAPARAAPGGAAGEIAKAFETFSEVYPKPVDPALADLFSETIVAGHASADEILEGARRAVKRGQFATAPGLWLKGKGWTKETEDKPEGRPRSGQRRSRPESAMELIARRYAREDGR